MTGQKADSNTQEIQWQIAHWATKSTHEEAKWPEIKLQWEVIHWYSVKLWGIEFWVTNTIFSTWLFMILLFILLFNFKRWLSKDWWFFKTTWLLIVNWLYKFASDFIGNKKFARKILFLTWWMFLFIFLANVFSLFLDWILLFAWEWLKLHTYLRPINSDLNTTFVLSILVIVISHFVAINSKWFSKYVKWYLFNFHWDNTFEKAVNVFVWWLHLIWEFSKTLSLSLRLFGNIFAWVVLIAMLAYLGWMISIMHLRVWEIFVLPFWFLELFVAFVQSVVFFVLASIYFKWAIEEHH